MDVQTFISEYRQAMKARDRAGSLGLVHQHREVASESARALARDGRTYTREGAMQDAYRSLTAALNIYEQLEDVRSTAGVRSDLASMYFAGGGLHEALAAARDAQDEFSSIEYLSGLQSASEIVIDIFGSFAGKAELRKFLKRHLRYAKERNLRREIERTTANLAEPTRPA